MTDVERRLRVVAPADGAGQVPPRSPEQRARMRRNFVAALDAQVRRDERARRPAWKKPAAVAAVTTAAGMAASAVLWLSLHPAEQPDGATAKETATTARAAAAARPTPPPPPTPARRPPRRRPVLARGGDHVPPPFRAAVARGAERRTARAMASRIPRASARPVPARS